MYYLSKSSPILYTSPAPIVINKSPLIQFFNKYFSMSSKLSMYTHSLPRDLIFSHRSAELIPSVSVSLAAYILARTTLSAWLNASANSLNKSFVREYV